MELRLSEKNIFVVIPAYNEEKNIKNVIESIKNVNDAFKIVVIDDCSSDSTYKIAAAANVSVLRHIINRGQGAALKTGTEYAIMKEADIIVHFDADGQFLASEISDLIKPIVAGEADIVFGSRFLGKSSNMPKLKKNIVMPLVRILQHLFFNIKTTDPQSGFRAFRSDAFTKLNWRNDQMAHCSEILYLSFKNKLKITEVPTTVIYNEFGQKISGSIKIAKDSFLNIFIKH
ncbi:glycosyltransferase family 2 protein [Candidatus Falkowbacteria bacterium CG10_big_fil_rev_8_21_14_0_10_37_6]|uniref:Glycosyltransferase family 2 protein n=1 Tax=Candidatus Falkowbacteria bacterium CG10_big_fil_rev_8_21_14_0_10_37_6 TaxID=1974563 RepID=A0A2H0V7U4_9BACT|nr:MAG: glycosyltransferase family 2 protein [Candidatus Falkowbacteria bacterium CG10_big_fil_rev_8_21_14_0_10_37_6]